MFTTLAKNCICVDSHYRLSNSNQMRQPLRFAASLLPILPFVTSYHQSNGHRQLTLIPDGHELISLHQQTIWHRELSSAQQHIRTKRNRHLKDRRLQRSECMSPLQRWFIQNIESIPSVTWDAVEQYNITTLAYLYKHYVHNGEGTDEYFGAYGERTNEMKENHAGLIEFWKEDVDTSERSDLGSTQDSIASSAASQHHFLTTQQSNVILLGMHGDDLSYLQTLVPTLQQIYSLEASEAKSLAVEIQSIIEELPGKYTNPLLTSNAIATQSSGGSIRERDSIIVGDGVFTFLEWLELSYDGPDYIHSHEYAHHVQYDLGEQSRGGGGMGDDGSPSSKADETRRLELMADVFGSYYLAHKEGGGFDASRLYEIHRSAFSLGDCQSKDGTHHGTPRQRECASNFGSNLAMPSYVDGGYKLTPSQLRTMFDGKFASILALDEDVCTPVVEESTLDKNIYGEDFDLAETPFFGDDGGFEETDNNGDLPPGYLEPVVSWFDPKPASYYDGGQTTSSETNQESSIEPESQSYDPYEPYDSYQASESSPQESNEWYSEEAYAEDEKEAPPNLIEADDYQQNGDDTGDDWFRQTNWGSAKTYFTSSGMSRKAPGFTVFISSGAIMLFQYNSLFL